MLPGIFLSCDRFLERRPFSFIYLTAIFALVMLTGHPVIIIYIGLVISIYLAFQLIQAWPREETNRGILLLLALLGSALVAFLIASPQLLPMLKEFRFSARTVGSGISLDTLQNTMHLRPAWIPKSLFPTPPHWSDESEFWSNSIRFPFYSLFLGFIGGLLGSKGPRRGYFIILCVFSILMALGPYVGLWKFVHSLPVLRHFRFPFRWLFFLPICVAFLSARGVDYLLSPSDVIRPVGFERMLKYIM